MLYVGPLIIVAWVCVWNVANSLVLQLRYFKSVARTPILKVPKPAGVGKQVVVAVYVDPHAVLAQCCVMSWQSLSLHLSPRGVANPLPGHYPGTGLWASPECERNLDRLPFNVGLPMSSLIHGCIIKIASLIMTDHKCDVHRMELLILYSSSNEWMFCCVKSSYFYFICIRGDFALLKSILRNRPIFL